MRIPLRPIHLLPISLLISLLILGPALARAEGPASAPTSRAASRPAPAPATAPAPTEKPAPRSFDGTILAPNGKPVAGAELAIPALGLRALSGRDGTVKLAVPDGQHRIEVSARGFAPHRELLRFDAALALAGFSIHLTYQLGEVVVTGATTEKRITETPVRTQVIARQAIERKGAANLAQALKHTTGVRLENNCQNCNFTQVRLNGMDGRYSQILLNGRPVFSALAGVYGLEQLPSEMIDRIEIVKGGGSALYGGSAVAGVLNVITKRPDRNFGSLRVGGFTFGGDWGGHSLGGNLGLVNASKTLALALSGSLRSREAWDENGDGFSDLGMYRQHALSADLYWDPVARGTLTARLQTLGERRRGGDHLERQEFDTAVSEGGTTLRQGAELRWKHAHRSGLSYELGYTFAHTSRDSYYGGGGDVTLPPNPTLDDYQKFWEAKSAAMNAYGRTRNPVHFGDLLLHLPLSFLGEMMLTAGAQLSVDGLGDEFVAYSRKVDATYIDVAGLLELDWNPRPWTETILGLRIGKHSEVDDALVTPRLAVTFTPRPWLRTRTSFSMGYRAPQVFEEDLHITIIGGEGAIVKNAPGLKPETSYSAAQQVEASLALGRDWSLKVGLNGFVNYLENSFVLDDVDDPATVGEREFVRTNRGHTVVFGGELELGLSYRDAFSVRGGWTLEKGTSSELDPDFATKRAFRTPTAYGFLEVSGKLLGLEPFTALELTGPMKVPHYSGYVATNRLEDSPWFVDWDLGVSYRLPVSHGPAFKLSLIGRNLLDSFQGDLDRGPLRDAGYVYGPALPRSLWFELKGEI